MAGLAFGFALCGAGGRIQDVQNANRQTSLTSAHPSPQQQHANRAPRLPLRRTPPAQVRRDSRLFALHSHTVLRHAEDSAHIPDCPRSPGTAPMRRGRAGIAAVGGHMRAKPTPDSHMPPLAINPFDGNHQRARVALAAWSRRHTGPCTPSDARAVETHVETIPAVRNRPSCASQNAAVQAAQYGGQ